MTADCEPAWTPTTSLEQLRHLAQQLRHDPHQHGDLQGQGLTGRDIDTITDLELTGKYL